MQFSELFECDRRLLAVDAIPLWLVSPQLVNTFLPGRFLTQENSEGIRAETGEENKKYSKNILKGDHHPVRMERFWRFS